MGHIRRNRLKSLIFHVDVELIHHRLEKTSLVSSTAFVAFFFQFLVLIYLTLSVTSLKEHVLIDLFLAHYSLSLGYHRRCRYCPLCSSRRSCWSWCRRWGNTAISSLAIHHRTIVSVSQAVSGLCALTMTNFRCRMSLARLGIPLCVVDWGVTSCDASATSFLHVTDSPPSDIFLAQIHKERCNAEKLSIFVGAFFHNDTIPSALPLLFLFSDACTRLRFIHGTEFWWRDIAFEVRRRIQKSRRMVVPWQCVDIFLTNSASWAQVFLAPSTVEVDIAEGHRYLFGASLPMLSYISSHIFSRGAAARLVIRIAHVEFSVTTVFQFINCAFLWRGRCFMIRFKYNDAQKHLHVFTTRCSI